MVILCPQSEERMRNDYTMPTVVNASFDRQAKYYGVIFVFYTRSIYNMYQSEVKFGSMSTGK